jgi:hypothetical protein
MSLQIRSAEVARRDVDTQQLFEMCNCIECLQSNFGADRWLAWMKQDFELASHGPACKLEPYLSWLNHGCLGRMRGIDKRRAASSNNRLL